MNRGRKKGEVDGQRRDWEGRRRACNENPYWLNSMVAGGRKIAIAQSDNRVASCCAWCNDLGSIKSW